MDQNVSIPREALSALLKAAGSPLTPEQFLASLLGAPDEFRKFAGRAKAAVWSKNILLSGVILSALITCTPMGFSVEGVLITVILAVITWFEFQVYYGFRDRNPGAPLLGLRNQIAFAIFIFIYGLYHAFRPMEIPQTYREVMDPDLTPLIQNAAKFSYLTIAVVGGISQACYAWYYYAARPRKPDAS